MTTLDNFTLFILIVQRLTFVMLVCVLSEEILRELRQGRQGRQGTT